MKKTTLLAALAAVTIAGSALAQTAPTQPETMPTAPSATTPPDVMAAPPAVTPPSSGETTAVPPAVVAPAPRPAIVLIERQKADEALTSEWVGAPVHAKGGERVGDVNDLVIDTTGRVAGVVIGIGGFLGMGEKNVAVDYASVTKGRDDKGRLRLTVDVTTDTLKTATPYVPVGKS